MLLDKTTDKIFSTKIQMFQHLKKKNNQKNVAFDISSV